MGPAAGKSAKGNAHRSLDKLAGVKANGRVLNVGAITRDIRQSSPGAGLFASAALNDAIIVKHNVRDNERRLFAAAKPVVTKIILPIDRANLSAGAATFMLGERSADGILRDRFGLRADGAGGDFRTLQLLDELATLDPFVVREELANEGIELPEAFAMSHLRENRGLHDHMTAQIAPLLRLALAGQTVDRDVAKQFIQDLFEDAGSERSDLLRTALRVESQDWPRAVHVWKAALSFNFRTRQIGSKLQALCDALKRMPMQGYSSTAAGDIADGQRLRLLGCLQARKAQLQQSFGAFEGAYNKGLIEQRSPDGFRTYLLSEHANVLSFGVSVGVLAQVIGYWDYWTERTGPHMPAKLFMDVSCDLIAMLEPARPPERQQAAA